ncbi:MAG TPA: hydroxymethylbilane synthase [Fibrobacteres bacterium]|jgi:hydroxymethylbilane synthase|nr:hydroxymethylbilane synthase [Fibrobacterota bacterium]
MAHSHHGEKLILGSRGSALALAQATKMKHELEAAHPGLEVQVQVIKTSGDADQSTRLDAFQAFGVFVKEIQTALMEGRIDAAVHSLKDVPEDEPSSLTLAAFPEREDARDAFISKGVRFIDLPKGAKIGTGSPRRIMQLRALRPDLEFVPIRGNLDTRIAKIERGDLAGVVLATAGLRRLEKASVITHRFSFSESIPAIGQAALALECRVDDARVHKLLDALNDPLTSDAVLLERRFMKAVGGGCRVPMAAHAYPYGDSYRFMAVMGDAVTGKLVRIERALEPDTAESEVDEIAAEILDECRAHKIRTPRDG